MMSDGESNGESSAAHDGNRESGGDSEQHSDGSDNESVDVGYDQEAGDYSNANEGIYDVVDDDDDDVDCDDDDDDDGDDDGYGWDEDDNFPPSLPSYVEADVTKQMTIVFNREWCTDSCPLRKKGGNRVSLLDEGIAVRVQLQRKQ
jgi:hypothetical protein